MTLRALAACCAVLGQAWAFATLAQSGGQDREVAVQAYGAEQAMSPSLIREIQQRLAAEGYYAGRADGVWGPGTQRALREFQASREGLRPTGRLDARSLELLSIGPHEPRASAGASAQQEPRQ